MFEQYTERAKRVLAFAKYEASQMGSDTMQAEHILLGLIREAEDVILRLFNKWKLDPEEVRAEVEMMSTFHKRRSAPVEIAISREAQRVLAYAVEENKNLQHKYVGTEHILLGLLREENSMAARILSQKGLRVFSLREDIVAFHHTKALAKAEKEARILAEQQEHAATDALARLGRALEARPPAYLFAPGELRIVANAFEQLAQAPLSIAILFQEDGLVVVTTGTTPATLEAWIDRIVLDLTSARQRKSLAEATVTTPDGRAIHIVWVVESVFLLVVPRTAGDLDAAMDVAAAAAAMLTPVFRPAPLEPPVANPLEGCAMVASEENTPMDLASKQCIPCRGGVPPLAGEELAKLAKELPSWSVVEGHHLSKTFTFPDFVQALAYVNRVGAMSEEQGHHPDIYFSWGKVRVDIWTHKIDGLTESDFVYAAKCDALEKP